MEDKKKSGVPLWALILGCVLCLVLGGASAMIGMDMALGGDGLTYLKTEALIQQRFVGEYDRTARQDQVLDTMITSLGDRWSYYLNPAEYIQVAETRKNEYVGIGVSIRMTEDGDGLTITKVNAGSPAQEAGLRAGEIIRSVAGTAITEENAADCVAQVKGKEGTQVALEIEGTDGVRRTVQVTRRTLQTVPARWQVVGDRIGVITIENFYEGTADQVRTGIDELTAQGVQTLVLDVRDNPGGYVTELTRILDMLLPEGVIFRSQDTGGHEQTYTSDAACVDLPLAVLVNEDSYSAAEFLASQLRESAGAVVAGTQTVGKGFSQQLFRLPNGGAIGLSTAKYFTGSGVSLIGTGLTPDPAVALSDAARDKLLAGELPYEEDLQLQAAVQALDLPEEETGSPQP